jgi:predicted house-cleaning noncanonical NTP pyrophosphatase (MazG superfamily)
MLQEVKLIEEANEFKEDKNIEEFVNIMEVLFGLQKSLRYLEDELLN